MGEADARRVGALLMSSAHGIAGLELSGHLSKTKWDVEGDDLVTMLVRSIEHSAAGSPAPPEKHSRKRRFTPE